MSYIAKVYNVMIASPGDTKEARQAAKEIIIEWNEIHSEATKIVLLPLMWEDNVTPELNNIGPQESIDEQIGKHADLLVAMFWTRVGTPTSLYESGTIQEIEKHIAKNKPAMLYFSKESVTPSKEIFKQIEAIDEIKRKYQLKGIYWEYNSLQDFKNLFNKHLPMKINQRKDYFTGYDSSQKVTQREQLSFEAIELLIAASKEKSHRIIRNPNIGFLHIEVNNQDFGIATIDSSIQRYYDAIDELVESEMAKLPAGDFVYLKTKGIDKARELISPLYEYPFTGLLEILDRFNQINNISFPVEEERVGEKRSIASQMSQFINDNTIAVQLVHYSLIGEFDQGKLVALMNTIFIKPSNENVPYIYSHYKKATEPFSKHAVIDVIKKYKQLDLIRHFDFELCNRILTEYDNHHNKALHDKITSLKKLLK
jgi:hypothetical protein